MVDGMKADNLSALTSDERVQNQSRSGFDDFERIQRAARQLVNSSHTESHCKSLIQLDDYIEHRSLTPLYHLGVLGVW